MLLTIITGITSSIIATYIYNLIQKYKIKIVIERRFRCDCGQYRHRPK